MSLLSLIILPQCSRVYLLREGGGTPYYYAYVKITTLPFWQKSAKWRNYIKKLCNQVVYNLKRSSVPLLRAIKQNERMCQVQLFHKYSQKHHKYIEKKNFFSTSLALLQKPNSLKKISILLRLTNTYVDYDAQFLFKYKNSYSNQCRVFSIHR